VTPIKQAKGGRGPRFIESVALVTLIKEVEGSLVHGVNCVTCPSFVCPKDVVLVTLIEEVKGGRKAKFTELEGRREDSRVSRTTSMCFRRTMHQTCS